ncbi:PREDICTED: uncharacterized protein LOC108562735 [Nicrophorus vespilloides]|uniref:Uncharacterized protein LOC108562735 n=1 Tax=Nicrophorus vespilloides TaxID=110193 RepID=A0ABM1MPZ2_NICVS|nr:PREDICTED: uncharacterized protein LOC108562735 [Nicrophorus vespilloides]
MMNSMETKVYIQIDTQEKQESVRNGRKKFHDLQHDGKDKENLVGRPKIEKETKLLLTNAESKLRVAHAKDHSITAEDLTCDVTSEKYWKLLAEKRSVTLTENCREIESLKEEVERLREENKTCMEMLEESRHLVQLLQEMMNEESEAES